MLSLRNSEDSLWVRIWWIIFDAIEISQSTSRSHLNLYAMYAMLRWSQMNSMDIHGHYKYLYIIKQALMKFELWMMWMSGHFLPIFYMRCLERMIGWSMHNWAQRRVVLVADEGQLWQLDILLWLPKVCMCCHWPPKNHPKPRGPSDAVKRQDTGSVDRVDFSQMTGTRSGYLTQAAAGWSHDGHQNRDTYAAIVIDCHRLIA